MIKKAGKTLKDLGNMRVFSPSDYYLMWAIFSISATLRLFKVTKPGVPFLDETVVMSDVNTIMFGNLPIDEKPLFGRFLVFLQYYFLRNGDSVLNSSDFSNFPNFYLMRIVSTVISSFVPCLVTASLLALKLSGFTAFMGGFLYCFDIGQIILSKQISTEPLFLLFSSLCIFFSSYRKQKRKAIFAQLQVLCAIIALSIDDLGILMVIYCIFEYKTMPKGSITKLISTAMFIKSFEIGLKAAFAPENHPLLPRMFHSYDLYEKCKIIIQVVISKYSSLKSPISRILYWPLMKLRPQIIWKSEESRFVVVNNLVGLLSISLASFFGCFFFTESYFFWLSIAFVWLLRPMKISSYQIPFIFGIISLSKGFNNFAKPIMMILSICLCVIVVLNFVIYFVWAYGIPISPEFNRDIDIWTRGM